VRIRTVTPLTAIEQSLTSGVPTYLLRQAITSAYKKAMIRDADRRRLSASLDMNGDAAHTARLTG
jgi:hypothetical protein